MNEEKVKGPQPLPCKMLVVICCLPLILLFPQCFLNLGWVGRRAVLVPFYPPALSGDHLHLVSPVLMVCGNILEYTEAPAVLG